MLQNIFCGKANGQQHFTSFLQLIASTWSRKERQDPLQDTLQAEDCAISCRQDVAPSTRWQSRIKHGNYPSIFRLFSLNFFVYILPSLSPEETIMIKDQQYQKNNSKEK